MLHMEQWYMYTQRPQWNTSDFAFAARHLSHRRVLREIFRLNLLRVARRGLRRRVGPRC